mgnify:CR=1 FL=1
MHRSHLRAPALTLALFADIACWWYGPFIDPEFTGASDPAGTDGLATDGPVTGDPVDPTGQPAPAACPSGTELVKAFEDTLRPLALRQDPDTCGIFLASTESVMGPPQGLLVHHIGEQGELIEQFTEPISSYGSAAFSDIEVGAADSLTLTARFVELPALKTSYKSDPLSWIPHAIARGDDHWLVAGVTGTQVHLAALGGAPFDESVTVSGDPVVNAVAAGATSTWVGGWYAVGDHTDPFLLRKDDALAAPLVPQQLPAALSTVYNDAISAVLVDASTVYALGYYKTEPSEYTLFLLAFAEDAEPTEQDLHEVGVAAGIPVISQSSRTAWAFSNTSTPTGPEARTWQRRSFMRASASSSAPPPAPASPHSAPPWSSGKTPAAAVPDSQPAWPTSLSSSVS